MRLADSDLLLEEANTNDRREGTVRRRVKAKKAGTPSDVDIIVVKLPLLPAKARKIMQVQLGDRCWKMIKWANQIRPNNGLFNKL